MVSGARDDSPIVRLGIAGLGGAGGGLLTTMARNPRLKITAAADVRKEALQHFATEFDAETYSSVADLCESPNVDAVYVATPHRFHAAHTIAAANRGKHVILEKPMALTLDDCDAMIAAAERNHIRLLVGRGSHGFDRPVLKVREIVRSGELGRLGMIHNWAYADFLYRQPLSLEEFDTRTGGGIFFNQAPHQIDLVRMVGGGLVRSVRAMAWTWDPGRPTEGSYTAFLDFEDGAVATVAYSGHNHFDSDEFHYWLGTYGEPKSPTYGRASNMMRAITSPEEEAALRAARGYGGAERRRASGGDAASHHPHFGVTLVSCERGDIRPSADGISIYDDAGKREVPVPVDRDPRAAVFDEFYDAVVNDRPLVRDGRWGKATIEVCLAILDSAKERREVFCSHQAPSDGEVARR